MARIPILIYHAIDSEDAPTEMRKKGEIVYVVEEGNFRRQLRLLCDNDYHGILLDDYVAVRASLKPASTKLELDDNLIEKPIIITFDDGHISNYTCAFPLLQEYGFVATFFITVKNIGSSHGMTWQQLREMADNGMSIQSHTMSHPFLSDLDAKQIRWELAESKSVLEDKLGRHVNYLALPGGRNSSIVKRMAKEIGYRAVCTSIVGSNTLTSDLYSLKRWTIKKDTSLPTFSSIIHTKRSIVAYYKTRYFLLGGLKKILGNQRYVAIREIFL